jgi:hypothetical protein
MRRAGWVVSLLFLLAPLAHSKDPVQWRTAIVLYSEYRSEPSTRTPVEIPTQIVRGEFEFDAGNVIYTAEERVMPRSRMKLSEGDTVELAIEKRTLMLKLPGNKIRKLKLLSSEAKPQPPSRNNFR